MHCSTLARLGVSWNHEILASKKDSSHRDWLDSELFLKKFNFIAIRYDSFHFFAQILMAVKALK